MVETKEEEIDSNIDNNVWPGQGNGWIEEGEGWIEEQRMEGRRGEALPLAAQQLSSLVLFM